MSHVFADHPRPKKPDQSTRTVQVVLLVLTGLTGLIDAESFLSFGHVFTANMTGNIVFLAFACAGVAGLSAARSGTALVGFLGGGAVGARMVSHLDAENTGRSAAAALFVQAASLLVASVVALESDVRPGEGQMRLHIMIALTALAMGVQNMMALRLAIPGLSPNVLTTALTGVAGASLFGTHDPVWKRRVASVATMFAGALLGARLWQVSAVWPLGLSAAASAACGLAMVIGDRIR